MASTSPPKLTPDQARSLAEQFKIQATKAGLSPEKQAELLKSINNLPTLNTPVGYLDRLVTADNRMLLLKEKICKLAPNNINVLIVGETGTGKELIARALHKDKKGKFIGVNCAGIPRELFESEFFGVIKGAYTGCIANREGYFEQANNGTIFLDEIAEIPYEIQCKLLRVIEERTLRRVGSSEEIPITGRVISATNCLDLAKRTREFRQDLYYRLRGSLVETIPLRERRNDIRLITQYFDPEGKVPVELVESWVNNASMFLFTGNIRELRNMIEEWICLNTKDL